MDRSQHRIAAAGMSRYGKTSQVLGSAYFFQGGGLMLGLQHDGGHSRWRINIEEISPRIGDQSYLLDASMSRSVVLVIGW